MTGMPDSVPGWFASAKVFGLGRWVMGIAAEGGRHGGVVAHRDLDDLGRELPGRVAEGPAEHARYQVEHHVAGRDEGRGRGLEPDYRLTGKDHRVAGRPEGA